MKKLSFVNLLYMALGFALCDTVLTGFNVWYAGDWIEVNPSMQTIWGFIVMTALKLGTIIFAIAFVTKTEQRTIS